MKRGYKRLVLQFRRDRKAIIVLEYPKWLSFIVRKFMTLRIYKPYPIYGFIDVDLKKVLKPGEYKAPIKFDEWLEK